LWQSNPKIIYRSFMSTDFINLLSSFPNPVSQEKAASLYGSMCDTYKKWVLKDVFCDYMTSRDRENILWHDYEAGGTDAKRVAPMQFAAIRTDKDLRFLDTPTDIYCQLHGDKLPHPVAIAITHINPMTCLNHGLPEPVFFRHIQKEMSVSNTCVCGYNSMGYDEAITRFGFWRNLLPIYTREYANGNSRWDLLPVTASFKALGVEGISWPEKSIKLVSLCSENSISQEEAHNALFDVFALVDWGRLLKSSHKVLWDYMYSNRKKGAVSKKVKEGAVVLHITSVYGADMNYSEPLLVLGFDKNNKNKAISLKLGDVEKIRACWHKDSETLKALLYARKDELLALKSDRPPLDSFAINNSPAIFPINWITETEGLNVPNGLIESDVVTLASKILSRSDFCQKLLSVFEFSEQEVDLSPEVALYSSGFPNHNDEMNVLTLSGQAATEAFSKPISWDNSVYHQLWQRCRYKMGGFGIDLNDKERAEWRTMCASSRLEEFKSEKHDFVTDNDVNEVLEETAMEDCLKVGYLSFLEAIKH
jgi:exodeoxyribonuclease-1